MFSCITCQPTSGELGASEESAVGDRLSQSPSLRNPQSQGPLCPLGLWFKPWQRNWWKAALFLRFQRQTQRLPMVSGARRCENGNMFQRLRFGGQVFQNTRVENRLNALPERLHFGFHFWNKARVVTFLCLSRSLTEFVVFESKDLVYINLPIANCTCPV